MKIAKAFRRYQVRSWLAQGIIKVRIFWDINQNKHNQNQQVLTSVQLIGSFTSPPWKVKIDLKYSSKLEQHYVDTLITRDSQFKFIVNGEKYEVSSYYPKKRDGQFENNMFFKVPFPKSICQRNKSIKDCCNSGQVIEVITDHQTNQKLEEQSSMSIDDVYISIADNINSKPCSARHLEQEFKEHPNTNRSHQSQRFRKKAGINQRRSLFNQTPGDPNKAKQRTFKYDVYDCQESFKSDSTFQNMLLEITSLDDSLVGSRQSPHRKNTTQCCFEEEQFIFVGSGLTIPKNPLHQTEDAFFVTDIGVGVSDGVGSWNNFGIDTSLFSRCLMQECQKLIQRIMFRHHQSSIDKRITNQEIECHRQALETSMGSFTSLNSSDSETSVISITHQEQKFVGSSNSLINFQSSNLCPTNILKFSMRRNNFPGSATASICVLNGRDLTALNLGDSGFILIRFDNISNEPYVLIRSKEQTHAFNTPYQLTRLPGDKEVDNLRQQNKKKELDNLQKALKEHKFCDDKPEDSDIYQLRVREGDLLIMATDGVFDNLFQEEIIAIVSKVTKDNCICKMTAQMISQEIAETACHKSRQLHIKTPFNIRKAQLFSEIKRKLQQQQQQNSNNTILNNKNGSLLHSQSSAVVGGVQHSLSFAGYDESEISEFQQKLLQDDDFESQCFGKGKLDDITVLTMWIIPKPIIL